MYTRLFFIVAICFLFSSNVWAKGGAFASGQVIKGISDTSNIRAGKFGEDFATEAYRLRGYTVIKNPNGHTGIDMIAYKGSRGNMTELKIVEVKTTTKGAKPSLTKNPGKPKQMSEKWIADRVGKFGKRPDPKSQMIANAIKSFATKNGTKLQPLGEVFHVDILNGKYTIYDDVKILRNTKFNPQPIDRSLIRIVERATTQTAKANAVRLLSEFDQLSTQALKEAPIVVRQGAGTATRAAQMGTVVRIGGGVAGIVFGVVDIGYGVYELREIDRRYYVGELDYDITLGKNIVVAQRMALGGTTVVAGILLLVPEPIITKAVALGLTITIIAGHAILMVTDYFLERTQVKRLEHRRKLLAKISWDTRGEICIDQLRAMANKI